MFYTKEGAKMNHILCFIGGAACATAVCVVTLGPWRQPDKALVLRCRERVERFMALPDADRAAYLDAVMRTPHLYTRWRATCALNNAFGGAPVQTP